jgi:hypothetical protein
MSWWGGAKPTYGGVEFWHSPERCGWLNKQGEGPEQEGFPRTP